MNNRIDGAYHEQNHFHQGKQWVDSLSGNWLLEFGRPAGLLGRLLGVEMFFFPREG
jgi:hypothetical protein